MSIKIITWFLSRECEHRFTTSVKYLQFDKCHRKVYKANDTAASPSTVYKNQGHILNHARKKNSQQLLLKLPPLSLHTEKCRDLKEVV